MPSHRPFLDKLANSLVLLDPSATYGVGVSGGADSVALLLGLVQLGFRSLVVCQVNHQLRGQQAVLDAEWVENLAKEHGLPFRLATTAVAELAERDHQSLEAAGRQARLGFFAEITEELALQGVLLAHHADDVVETVLLHLFRGTAGRGLHGMAVETQLPGLRLLRPLLEVRRQEILAFLEAQNQPWREDPTNAEATVVRNRLRLELLPLAESIFERDVAKSVLRLAEHQRTDEAWWAKQMPPEWQDEKLAVKWLKSLSAALVSRLLVQWLRQRHRIGGISSELIASAVALLHNEYPASCNLPKGLRLRRSQGFLWVERSSASLRD